MSKKGPTFFWGLNKYVSVTHVFTCIFKGLFKYIVFRSVALVIKSYRPFEFFLHRPDFLPPYALKKIDKKSFKLLFFTRM